MKAIEELRKEQNELDKTIIACPKCGQDALWEEVREFDECFDCYYHYQREKNNPRKLEIKNKMKTYSIYFKSHCEAPDYEDETEAETREEAMKIFLSRCKELAEIDKLDLIKNIWCDDDIPF